MVDTFNLQRFVGDQEHVYPEVLDELRSGIKRGHWIWYIFPQIAGLGESDMCLQYSIGSLEEACAYSEHPILGKRLIECVNIVLAVEGNNIEQMLGYPDYLKFCSCMTLFSLARPDEALYQQALDRYFDGVRDPLTIDALDAMAP